MFDKRTLINGCKAVLIIAAIAAGMATGTYAKHQIKKEEAPTPVVLNLPNSAPTPPPAAPPVTASAPQPESLAPKESAASLPINEVRIPTKAHSIPLRFGKPLEKKLKEGNSEVFNVDATEGQYTQVKVEQKGIDIAVLVYTPGGKNLLIVNNSNNEFGTETIHLIWDKNSRRQLEVRGLKKRSDKGRYKIMIEEQRSATQSDRELTEAQGLNSSAEILYSLGRYDEALAPAERALAIRERVLGPVDPAFVQSLNNLALIRFNKGEYAEAEALFQRALVIKEKTLGADRLDVAEAINNLALIRFNKGEYVEAEALTQRALAIREKAADKHPLDVAQSINNLALIYQTQGDYDKAEPLLRRALEIREKALGKEHPDVAQSFNNLALTCRAQGKYDKAEPLLRRALKIREKALGKEHPDVAVSLNGLAALYLEKGDLAKAEPLFQRALTIREKALGSDHPHVASVLNGLALLYRAKGKIKEAVAQQALCNEVRERDLVRNLASGSQRQKLLYLNLSAMDLDRTLSLHMQSAPSDPTACRIAFEILLRRKGRSLDAMTDSIAELRRRASAEDQNLLDELSQSRSKLSSAILEAPGKESVEQRRAYIKLLENLVEELEAKISARSEEFRIQSQPITLDAVRKAIPKEAALVEFAAYRPYDIQTNRYAPLHYAAYVQSHDGEPLWADLGEAEFIDKAADELRRTLRDRKTDVEREVKPKARALDELVMKPVRKLIGTTRRLLISPDGSLNLTPFDALVDEDGKYLVDSYEISYLTSGRDLLRLQTKLESRQPPLVVADPDFAEGPGPRFGETEFEPLKRLKASADEAAQIISKFADAGALMQAEATKSAIKNARRPMLLHIATHGFFLKDEDVKLDDTATERLAVRKTALYEEALLASKSKLNNPLLRSGLFFAGANAKGEEAVLTAMEAAGLDLWGTKLVVLSACDTGVGDVKNGDGVYGLRRALVLAGSESQIISLWPVSDEGTRDLMAAYYEALKDRQGRSEGLRKVRLELLSKPERSHPYYWASFIQSGEWANLDGER